ncbi:MAG TPA: fatty acid CoA ligase family protein [Myxococcaceae bacterium]
MVTNIPLVPRAMLSALRRRFPSIEPERVWLRLDQEAPRPGERPLEALLADALKPYRHLIAVPTLGFFLACLWLIYGEGWKLAARLSAAGHGALAVLVPISAGMLVHGLTALVVHEATHGNLWGRRADPWISSATLGMLLLPFAAETYQHFHLIHHKVALEKEDPNWTTLRQRLFEKSRLLYAIYELVPVINNFDRLPKRAPRSRGRTALAWALAVAVWVLLRPPPLYVLAVFFGFNMTNALRLWTEHFGFWRGQVANVFYCPFGFGIGNHALHHRSPKIPAVAMTVGLMVRKRDGSMLLAPLHLLFSGDYGPFHTHPAVIAKAPAGESEVPGDGGTPEENIASTLQRSAREKPKVTALHLAEGGASITFEALRERAGCVAARLRASGIGPGDRVLLMIKPGVEFAAAFFGTLAVGAVAVLIDPGLGPRRMLECVTSVRPKAMISVRALHVMRLLRPNAFRSVELVVSERPFPGARSFRHLLEGEPWMEVAPRRPEDAAIITFTSGSTGEPKGVVIPHRVLKAQVRTFQALFDLSGNDLVLAAFPALILLGPGLGVPVVLPEIDARRPALFDPTKLVDTIRRYGTTHSFGSPAIWGPVGRYCEQHGVTLPTMRRLAMGGAPIAPEILERFAGRLAPDAEVTTPYGSTEAVPVAIANTAELRAEWAQGPGRGVLVGRPVEGAEVRIVQISDGPLSEAVPLGTGEIGEIAVRGDIVSPAYFGRPDADALAKIPDAGGTWHRMGDLGYLDERGRLWFCGRKSERVETKEGALYTARVEPLFSSDARVRRVALVGVGSRPEQRAVLVVEPEPAHWPRSASARRELADAVLAKGASGPPEVRALRDVLFNPRLPLDIRHNAKILRGVLAQWAARRLS